jgi:hypothetical protein
MRITVGATDLVALPAHFMHAEGNFQFWDPVSGILFSGDLGVSLIGGRQAGKPDRQRCSRCTSPAWRPFTAATWCQNKILQACGPTWWRRLAH